jgi:hypothetical protein
MSDLERCAVAPPNVHIGRYRIERNPVRAARWHRWGICDEHVGRGVSNHPTLLHAMLALRRWKREPARPAEGP